MILVTGAAGQLGTAFRKILPDDSAFLGRADLDLTDLDGIGPTIAAIRPTAVINCAAYTAVDQAESDEGTANTVNGRAVGELALACRDAGARFVTFSSDYVFDGRKDGGYVESDTPNPINAYGRSKLLGERLALEKNPDALVVRTSWLLSGTHPNFARTILSALLEGQVSIVDDQYGRPTLVDDLAPATFEAMNRGAAGILHLTNGGVTTWFGLALEIALIAGVGTGRIRPCTTADYTTSAARPANAVLRSERLRPLGLSTMANHQESLPRVVREMVDGG